METTTPTTTTTPEQTTAGTDAKTNPMIEKVCGLLKQLKLSDELIAKVKEELTKNQGGTTATTVSVEVEKTENKDAKEEGKEGKDITATLFPGHKIV